MKRRKFIRTLTGIRIAGFLTGMYSWQVEPFWLEFVKVPMPLPNLPGTLEGKTIMQLSDLHVGNRFSRQYLVDSLIEAQAHLHQVRFNVRPEITVFELRG